MMFRLQHVATKLGLSPQSAIKVLISTKYNEIVGE